MLPVVVVVILLISNSRGDRVPRQGVSLTAVDPELERAREMGRKIERWKKERTSRVIDTGVRGAGGPDESSRTAPRPPHKIHPLPSLPRPRPPASAPPARPRWTVVGLLVGAAIVLGLVADASQGLQTLESLWGTLLRALDG